MSLSIQPLSPNFVGEVSGIDLTQPIGPDDVAAIEAGMDRYAVLVFHDQRFTDEQQKAFSRNFGELEHTAGGKPKLLHRCTLPLTGAGVVDMVISELAVFEIDRHGSGARLIELAPGVTLAEVQDKTEASFTVAL